MFGSKAITTACSSMRAKPSLIIILWPIATEINYKPVPDIGDSDKDSGAEETEDMGRPTTRAHQMTKNGRRHGDGRRHRHI